MEELDVVEREAAGSWSVGLLSSLEESIRRGLAYSTGKGGVPILYNDKIAEQLIGQGIGTGIVCLDSTHYTSFTL